ncbi:MAG: ATP synthase F1 subunit delta [Bacilli bacterium]|nr:ATP synthase F1 subunit delta [Bacilli bacterium]MBR3266720.1 ATP synthase F1 subunit delta [Bacilli bacterium]
MRGAEANAYAAGLYELALEREKVSSFQEEMKEVLRLFRDNPELLETLSSYSLPEESLNALVDKVFGGLKNKEIPAFLKLLMLKHEIIHFEIIASSFNNLCNDYCGIKEGIVYSAEKLSEAEIKKIEKSIGERLSSKVELENHVDHRLIGGVKVYVDDKVFDGTILGKIERLRSSLLKNDGGKI